MYPLYFDTQPESYKLLELPSELCKLVESGAETQLTIRGRANDDAVLCTQSRTYALRAVTLSNTILITTAPATASMSASLVVRDQVSQVLELVAGSGRVQRLQSMLKGCEYDEDHEDRPVHTKETVRGEMQASDAELDRALIEQRVLEMAGGQLRPVAPAYLRHILESLLTALISQGFPLPPKRVPVRQLERYLKGELEVSGEVIRQVLGWFGELDEGTWKMDDRAVVKEIGLGYLRRAQEQPVGIAELEAEWRAGVGDYFAELVDLRLLQGNYLLYPAPAPSSMTPPKQVRYFAVSSASMSPEELLAELFAVRACWRAEDISVFVGGDWLATYARASVVEGGTWYTARRIYG